MTEPDGTGQPFESSLEVGLEPAEVDPGELTIVVVPRGDVDRNRRWAKEWATTPALHGARVVLAHEPDRAGLADVLRETLRPDEVVALPADDELGRPRLAAALLEVLLAAPTRYVTVTTVNRGSAGVVDALHRHLGLALARVEALDVGTRLDGPVLLPVPSALSLAAQAYLGEHLRRAGQHPDDAVRTYLAHLALSQGAVTVEGIDPVPATGEIEVHARVSTGRLNAAEPPPWGYEIALLRSGTTEVVATAPAELSRRVDNLGARRFENLRARLPLTAAPEGNYRVIVLATARNRFVVPQRLARARPGAIAPARTVLLPSGEGHPATRYLVHTRGRDGHTWLTVQHGDAARDVRRWRRTLLRKDLSLLVRDRNVGMRIRLARLVRLVTRPFFARREIWLVAERADTAQDNGMHLFRHLRTAHPEREVFYVIDPASPHVERVRELGNVVAHSSWRHQLLMMHAAVLANAYSINHMVPRQWPVRAYTQHLAWRVGAVRVYLKHGVNVSANTVKRGTGGYDLYLSVNPRETAALRESSGYGEHVQETGMPRYDALTPAPPSRTVLFMPTWRRYLVPKLFGDDDDVARVPFEGSTYERFVLGLLHSERLHALLAEHDFTLQFLPHYNLAQHLSTLELTSPRTVLADTSRTSFSDLIRGCDVFVTDHSSVHFDVAYLGTPVVYAHFDPEEYAEGHASTSWFVHERDGFGPVVATVEETIDALEEILARGCTLEPRYRERVDAAFTFRDHDNSARVVAAVERQVASVRAAG